MANTVANVSAGKPRISGGIYVAPLGTTLPTSADGTLNTAFKSVGYIGDEGVKNNPSRTSTNVKAWGGDTVLTTQSDFEDTFDFTLLEVLNAEALKVVFGDDNVTGTSLTTGISVKANGAELESLSWVIDMVMRGGVLKRIVIPHGKVTNTEEITYSDNDAVGYGITVTAMPDSTDDHCTHYEYIKTPSTTTAEG